MNTKLDEYASGLLGYDDDMFIGYLIWYSVPTSVSVPYKQLNKKLLEVFGAFDTKLPLPRAPKAHDVFKRACSDVGKTRIELDGGHVARYLIHDAGHDSAGIYREVVKEVLDKEGHKLSHGTIGKLIYLRGDDSVSHEQYEGINEMDEQVFGSIQAQVHEYYTTNLGNIASSGVRYVILDILHVVLRSYTARSSGGVYFVSKDYGQYLAPLAEALETITDETGFEKVQFHYLPLIDDTKQREMLKAAFTADVNQRMNELATEVSKLLESGNRITPARFGTIHGKFKDIKGIIGEQEEMLQDGLDTANAAAKLLNKQMMTLIKQVK